MHRNYSIDFHEKNHSGVSLEINKYEVDYKCSLERNDTKCIRRESGVRCTLFLMKNFNV